MVYRLDNEGFLDNWQSGTRQIRQRQQSESMAEPSASYGHVAASVEGKVYVWGGLRRYGKVSHDGPNKAKLIFSVDILDVKVSSVLG